MDKINDIPAGHFFRRDLKADLQRIGLQFSCRPGTIPSRYINSCRATIFQYIKEHRYMDLKDFFFMKNVETNHKQDRFRIIGIAKFDQNNGDRLDNGTDWFTSISQEVEEILEGKYDELTKCYINECIWRRTKAKIKGYVEGNVLKKEATTAMYEENYADAVALFSDAIEIVESPFTLLPYRARCYVRINRPKEALRDYFEYQDYCEKNSLRISSPARQRMVNYIAQAYFILGIRHLKTMTNPVAPPEVSSGHSLISSLDVDLLSEEEIQSEPFDSIQEEIVGKDGKETYQTAMALLRKGMRFFKNRAKISRLTSGYLDCAINAFTIFKAKSPMCPICRKYRSEFPEYMVPPVIMKHFLENGPKRTFSKRKEEIGHIVRNCKLHVCRQCHEMSKADGEKFFQTFYCTVHDKNSKIGSLKNNYTNYRLGVQAYHRKQITYGPWLNRFISTMCLKQLLVHNLFQSGLTDEESHIRSTMSRLRGQILKHKLKLSLYMWCSPKLDYKRDYPTHRKYMQSLLQMEKFFDGKADLFHCKLGQFHFIHPLEQNIPLRFLNTLKRDLMTGKVGDEGSFFIPQKYFARVTSFRDVANHVVKWNALN